MPQIGTELASIISEATDKLNECASNNYGHSTAVRNQIYEIAGDVVDRRTAHHEMLIDLLRENMWLGVTDPESGECLSPFDAARANVMSEVESALFHRFDEIVDEWRINKDDEDGYDEEQEDNEHENSKDEQRENAQFESGGAPDEGNYSLGFDLDDWS